MSAEESITRLIRQLEEHLLQPEVRHSGAEIEKLLASGFVEFGSDGKIYDRASMTIELAHESEVRISITDFRTALLAPEIALATYRAVISGSAGKADTQSLRSSIWKKTHGAWRLVFHQGTPIAGL